ncbi:hypothetical protein V1477_011442 [Vespula maculifrons]|uniref:Uncharacterized protein n=1 Tax=Vespula maculifrons TaxID=7453 RepID=A0ABD2BZ73_VESMC
MECKPEYTHNQVQRRVKQFPNFNSPCSGVLFRRNLKLTKLYLDNYRLERGGTRNLMSLQRNSSKDVVLIDEDGFEFSLAVDDDDMTA